MNQFSSVQSISRVQFFATPWISACQTAFPVYHQLLELSDFTFTFHFHALEKKLTSQRYKSSLQLIYSVQFSCLVMSDSLWPRGLQHARPPCPSPTPGFTQTQVHWVSDAIQPSHPLSSPSPPAFSLFQHQGLFPMSHLFISGGQIIGALVSASVFSMNTQGWFPLGLTGLISLQSKGLSRVSSSTTI